MYCSLFPLAWSMKCSYVMCEVYSVCSRVQMSFLRHKFQASHRASLVSCWVFFLWEFQVAGISKANCTDMFCWRNFVFSLEHLFVSRLVSMLFSAPHSASFLRCCWSELNYCMFRGWIFVGLFFLALCHEHSWAFLSATKLIAWKKAGNDLTSYFPKKFHVVNEKLVSFAPCGLLEPLLPYTAWISTESQKFDIRSKTCYRPPTPWIWWQRIGKFTSA